MVESAVTLYLSHVNGTRDGMMHVERSCESRKGCHLGREEKVCDPWDASKAKKVMKLMADDERGNGRDGERVANGGETGCFEICRGVCWGARAHG